MRMEAARHDSPPNKEEPRFARGNPEWYLENTSLVVPVKAPRAPVYSFNKVEADAHILINSFNVIGGGFMNIHIFGKLRLKFGLTKMMEPTSTSASPGRGYTLLGAVHHTKSRSC